MDMEKLKKWGHGKRMSLNTAQKAKHILGCIKSSIGSTSRKVMLPLCCTLMRPNLEHYVQLWGSQHKKVVDLRNESRGGP
ncbi:hypothetical protein WISP_128387 [Willisornis vidua]|uniref:Uncharacterized protein n=1 Tax=Willisornis vidua TaxID=1566151 RepID=A0ABQ9CQ97_9PASS|nr:hypothetical protein WISP_128387 [Willisornis vidua]